MNDYPVRVRARHDPNLNRWLWLVKWALLIPHLIVLAVLSLALVVTTLVAYLAVLFTGRYPRGIFDFNLGVLRWGWRVGYYGYEVLGTDRYPPFSLGDVADYPAGLDVEYRANPPRWLPLVAWLLATPHWLIVGAFAGAAGWQFSNSDRAAAASLSVVTAGALIIGVALLFTGRHLTGLYDLLVGVARWSLRLSAYVVLLPDGYPPFRLDLGDTEPTGPVGAPGPGDGATTIVHPAPVPNV